MSVWTDVKGELYIQKGCGFSVSSYVEANFDEVIALSVEQSSGSDYFRVQVEFTFSDSNLPAAGAIQALVDKVREADKRNTADLTASIRFLS